MTLYLMTSHPASIKVYITTQLKGIGFVGKMVASTAKRKRVIKGDTSLMTYRGHGVLHTLIRCYFSPQFSTGQRYIYTGCGTGKIIIYDVLTGEIVSKLDDHRAAVRDVSWHPYEPKIISSSWDGTHGLWTYRKDDYPEDFSDPEDSLDEDSGTESDIFHVIRRKSRRLVEQRRKRERAQRRLQRQNQGTT